MNCVGFKPNTPTQGEVKMSEWMPIETAPRDWTDVILYVPDEDDCSGSRGVVKGWYSMRDGGFDCWMSYESNSGEVYPTHWQPLPFPPSKAKGETK